MWRSLSCGLIFIPFSPPLSLFSSLSQVLRYELTDVIPDHQVANAMDAQATAERRRRETILNAEAQREKLEKESMGQRQSYINIAEGERQKVVLAAEAKKQELILEAEGRAKVGE